MREAYVLTRAQKLFVVCAGIFITALVIAEATASKFFTAMELPFTISILGEQFDTVIMTAGVIAFPVTFIVTDLLNEYYGKKGIRFVTIVGMAMIMFEFAILQIAMAVPTASISPVPEEAFNVEGTDEGDTKAKPEIWSDWNGFTGKLTKFQGDMAQLAKVSSKGDERATTQAFGVAANNCKSCHTDYKFR